VCSRLLALSALASAAIVRPRRVVRMYPSSSRETDAARASAAAGSSNVRVMRARAFIG